MLLNVERLLLCLTGCKWYSVVVRNLETLLLGSTGRKCYSVVVLIVERLLLGLTDCKYKFNFVTIGVLSVLYDVSKMPCGAIDCDDAHCYSGRKII